MPPDLELWGVFFLGAFIWVTLAWGLINWLPIGGLDGWHILAELLERWLPGRGRRAAAVIGLVVALGAGWFLFQIRNQVRGDHPGLLRDPDADVDQRDTAGPPSAPRPNPAGSGLTVSLGARPATNPRLLRPCAGTDVGMLSQR